MRRTEAPVKGMKRVLCFGSRGWCSDFWIDVVMGEAKPGVVIAREARGADQRCRRIARARRIPVESYRVEHDKDGLWPDAGKNANGRMLREAQPVHLALGFVVGIRGSSLTPGSRDMLEKLFAARVPVVLVRDGGVPEDDDSARWLARRPS